MKDYKLHGFRTARNTLEAKQFFRSQEAIDDFIHRSRTRRYIPPYKYLLKIKLEETCLELLNLEEQDLDGHKAITIQEEDLSRFNNCIKFEEVYVI